MQPMPHQVMGYDRAITMFSPDGRLLQVEYAKKTVRQGSTAIGIVCSDGVLLVTDKRIVDSLIIPESVEIAATNLLWPAGLLFQLVVGFWLVANSVFWLGLFNKLRGRT